MTVVNASAGWLGDAYPAPGATLRVAMVFGHRAGRHAARVASAALDALAEPRADA